ncbi:hypothetical protein VTL71DRAFT_1650 [Oculimacula yallundae]|uniref:ethanolamine kinase n=1 Tax=Oculimacula yallundae TaxID=86028 RepID=A0ABR4CBB3_9HELO
MASEIPTVDLRYEQTEPESLIRIIQALLPSWNNAATQKLTGGVNNVLFKVTKNDQHQDHEEHDLEAVLVRVYGGSSGILVDRERELECHILLQKHGLAPRIVGRFENGYIYGFVPGKVCSPTDLALEPVWRGIAKRMAEWHATLPLEEPASLNIWSVLKKWITALSTSTKQQKTKRDDLIAEAKFLTSQFQKTEVRDMPELVLAHCDLLAGNIVISPRVSETDSRPIVEQVYFIDFEYAMSAPAAFEIACHFSEWVGFGCDYKLLPSRSARRQFLLQYTSTYNKLCEPRAQIQNVDKLCSEVDRFRGVPGLLWGVAALIQAQVSEIDFDFNEYADLRIREYMDWKAEMDGSREASGKEQPFREQMWARED